MTSAFSTSSESEQKTPVPWSAAQVSRLPTTISFSSRAAAVLIRLVLDAVLNCRCSNKNKPESVSIQQVVVPVKKHQWIRIKKMKFLWEVSPRCCLGRHRTRLPLSGIEYCSRSPIWVIRNRRSGGPER